MGIVGEEFQRPSEGRAAMRIQHWNSFSKKTGEGFREYWLRYERLMGKLAMSGVVWPGAVAYQQAFATLMLTHDQQILARETMEVEGKPIVLTNSIG